MSNKFFSLAILGWSIVLAGLVIGASSVGLFIPNFYVNEKQVWMIQCLGQDAVDLYIIVPVLIAVSILAYRGSDIATTLWAGTILYLVYSFAIYSFAVHFNSLFIVYCIILGISFYLFLYFIVSVFNRPMIHNRMNPAIRLTAGSFLILLAIAFCLLWLSAIIPANFRHYAPVELSQAGLLTNPVHALDLSVYLPAMFTVGWLVMKKKPLGLVLAPVMLMFCVLMDITIASLASDMKGSGFQTGYSLIVSMLLLGLFTMVLLSLYLRASFRKK